MAACLAWGVGSVASHQSAGELLALAGFEDGVIELTVPVDRNRKGPGIVHRNRLTPRDVTAIHRIPSTGAFRTLLDLAGVAARDRVEEALDDALRRRIVRARAVYNRLDSESRRGRPGITVLRSLVKDRVDGTVPQSPFETKMLRALKKAGLPKPATQFKVVSAGRTAIIDFAYPAQRLAIETEGYRWHSGRPQWERDLARRNALTLLGWRVIHVTWSQLTRHQDQLVQAIALALETSDSF